MISSSRRSCVGTGLGRSGVREGVAEGVAGLGRGIAASGPRANAAGPFSDAGGPAVTRHASRVMKRGVGGPEEAMISPGGEVAGQGRPAHNGVHRRGWERRGTARRARAPGPPPREPVSLGGRNGRDAGERGRA